MLELLDVDAGYGKKPVLNRVSLRVDTGEIVALLGHNGAGKSTLLKAICGLVSVSHGKVLFKEHEVQNRSPAVNVLDGIVYSPQGNRVFTELTVSDNLEICVATLQSRVEAESRLQRVFSMFPTLRDRRKQVAGALSGGEQQMLALGNALMLSPELLLLDEPSLGLSTHLVRDVFEMLAGINRTYGVTMLIVEQKIHEVLRLSNRAYVLKLGCVASTASSKVLLDESQCV